MEGINGRDQREREREREREMWKCGIKAEEWPQQTDGTDRWDGWDGWDGWEEEIKEITMRVRSLP